MNNKSADDRIAVIVLTVHAIVYPRRKNKSGLAFVDLVRTFIDADTRRRLADIYDPAATKAVISAAVHCAQAVRECKRVDQQRPAHVTPAPIQHGAH